MEARGRGSPSPIPTLDWDYLVLDRTGTWEVDPGLTKLMKGSSFAAGGGGKQPQQLGTISQSVTIS